MAASTHDSRRTAHGLRIGTIVGVPVYIATSWLFIALVIVVINGPQLASSRPDLGPRAYAVAVGYAVMLLISVLAHEAAHAVVGILAGYSVKRVVADVWGAHTTVESATARPATSALVAVAGPAANALLALLGKLILPHISGDIPFLLVTAMAYTNAVLAALNLLPGLPLDGGFLVESLVWRITGSRESGLIAAGWCGRVVTVLLVLAFVGWPLWNGRPPDLFTAFWTVYIGGFVWMGATNAIRAGHGGRLLAGIRIDSVWRRAASLPAHASAAQALALRNSGPGGTAVVVEDQERTAIGLVDDEALRAIPEQSLGGVVATSVMRQQPDGWVVEATPDQSIATVVAAMQRLGIGAVPVRGPDGLIAGIVNAGDLEAALSRRSAPQT